MIDFKWHNPIPEARNQDLLIGISLLALTFTSMATGASSPALASIGGAFPNAPSPLLSMIATLPLLVSVPASLICGQIISKTGKYRIMAIIGLCLMLFGGLAPFTSNRFEKIIAWRALYGCGSGFIAPLAPALTLTHFSGSRLSNQLSKNSAMSNIGGIIFQFIGGLLGSIGWRYCFLSYSLLIPSLVIILILLRDPPASAPSPLINPPVEQIKPVKGHKLFSVFFVSWSVFYFLYGVLICPIITDTSAVILQSGLGDSTSAGLALTVFTIGGFTGSFSFKYMVKRIYKQAMTLLAILGFAGSVLLIFAYNLPIYVAGAFIFGAGFGISLPAVVLFVGISVKESQKAVAASILLALYSSGNFFSPLLVSWIKTIYGITYIRFSYVLSAVCFAALIIRFIFLKTYAYEREILCPKK